MLPFMLRRFYLKKGQRFGSLQVGSLLHDFGSPNNPITSEYVADTMQEILDSYALVFVQSHSAREEYRKRARDTASQGRPIDPLLDELCGFNRIWAPVMRLGPVISSFDALSHFPILGGRLIELQAFMHTRRARGLRAIYQDRRDSFQWWTFWAVVWFGGISIPIALCQMSLAVVQVWIALQAYTLQLAQTQNLES